MAEMIVAQVLGAPGAQLIKGLHRLYRDKFVLAVAVLAFTLAGVGCIIVSAVVTGWWREFLLHIGTPLLFIGAINLGLLGVLNRIMRSSEGAGPPLDPQELASALRQAADRIESPEPGTV